jgi:hypothetical protein
VLTVEDEEETPKNYEPRRQNKEATETRIHDDHVSQRVTATNQSKDITVSRKLSIPAKIIKKYT